MSGGEPHVVRLLLMLVLSQKGSRRSHCRIETPALKYAIEIFLKWCQRKRRLLLLLLLWMLLCRCCHRCSQHRIEARISHETIDFLGSRENLELTILLVKIP